MSDQVLKEPQAGQAVGEAPSAGTTTPPQPPAAGPTSRRHPFAALRQEIDRLFDDMSWPTMRGRGGLDTFRDMFGSFGAVPAVDLVERDADYELTADLPGYDPKDIEVRLEGGILTIRGASAASRDTDEQGYHLHERSYGTVSRSLAVPGNIDPDKVAARYENGVLKVSLPKTAAARAQARKIEVRSA